MELVIERWGTRGGKVVCVHGSLSAGAAAFAEQKTLADRWQLIVPYRRGYGDNPRVDRVNNELDAADVVEMLGEGAHLVGTSMGGVVSLIAAGLKPQAVKSLTLIEPPAFGAALDIPDVRDVAAALKKHYSRASPADLPAFCAGFLTALGLNMTLPTPHPPHLQRAMSNLTTERPWRCDVPTGAVADAPFPKLVVSGGWSPAFEQIADRLAALLSADRRLFPGTGHAVQRCGAPFNELLAEFLQKAESPLAV